jgi:hypothetical protein
MPEQHATDIEQPPLAAGERHSSPQNGSDSGQHSEGSSGHDLQVLAATGAVASPGEVKVPLDVAKAATTDQTEPADPDHFWIADVTWRDIVIQFSLLGWIAFGKSKGASEESFVASGF